jgi:hypothetical protein
MFEVHEMKMNFSKSLSQAALVAALALTAGFAAAQTGMAGASVGPLGAHAGGPAAHAGKGAHDAHIGKRLEAIKAQLNLNGAQDAQFATAKAASEKAIAAGKAARIQMAQTGKTELSKADPDLANLLLSREAAQDAAHAERRAATVEWAKFLSLLNAEQKQVVKSQLIDRMQRAQAMRENFASRAKG